MQTSPETPIDTLRAIVADLCEFCDAHDIQLADLCQEHHLNEADIQRLRAGSIDPEECAALLPVYQAAANAIGGEAGEADPLYDDFSTAKMVRAAFSRLRLSRTSAKLIVVEGNTGMGKTSAGRIISAKLRELNPVAAIYHIEASAGWGDRPNAMYAAMLRALGMPDNSRSQAARESKLIEALAHRPATFIVDEIHDVGVRCLRAIKHLLNEGPTKIVMLTHPRLFRDLERENWDDVGQLTGNRLLARIDLGRVNAADVALMFQRRLPQLNGDTKAAAEAVAKAAQGNGNYAFARETIIRLQRHAVKLLKNRQKPKLSLTDVETHLRAELRDRKALALA